MQTNKKNMECFLKSLEKIMKLLLSAPLKRVTSKRHKRDPEFEGISKTLKEKEKKPNE